MQHEQMVYYVVSMGPAARIDSRLVNSFRKGARDYLDALVLASSAIRDEFDNQEDACLYIDALGKLDQDVGPVHLIPFIKRTSLAD